jgi:phosphatidate cytidylyltransferase
MSESSPTSPAVPQPTRGRVFLRRLSSSLILWSVVLGAMFSGHDLLSDAIFLVIMAGLSAVGLMEFYGLVEKRGLGCFKREGILGGMLLMVSTFICFSGVVDWVSHHEAPAKANDFEVSFLILFVLGLCVRQFISRANTAGILAISTTLFGLMYVPWLLNFIQKIYYFPRYAAPGTGAFFVLYFILVTKMSDTGAYCVGSLIGRHKMVPRISPGKTWEGFAGALIFSVCGSVIFAKLAGARLGTTLYPGGMPLCHAALLGLILAIAAVVGDLIESIFKREAGVKDSGGMFPGIGGILDLLDSLLFNAPLMYLYLRHVLTN